MPAINGKPMERCWNCWEPSSRHRRADCPKPRLSPAEVERLRLKLGVPLPSDPVYLFERQPAYRHSTAERPKFSFTMTNREELRQVPTREVRNQKLTPASKDRVSENPTAATRDLDIGKDPQKRQTYCWNCWSRNHSTDTCPKQRLHTVDREARRRLMRVPLPANPQYILRLHDSYCYNCWRLCKHLSRNCPDRARTMDESEKWRKTMKAPLPESWAILLASKQYKMDSDSGKDSQETTKGHGSGKHVEKATKNHKPTKKKLRGGSRDERDDCWNCWSPYHEFWDCPEPQRSWSEREDMRVELGIKLTSQEYKDRVGFLICSNCWKAAGHHNSECPELKLSVEERERLRYNLGFRLPEWWRKYLQARGVYCLGDMGKPGGGRSSGNPTVARKQLESSPPIDSEESSESTIRATKVTHIFHYPSMRVETRTSSNQVKAGDIDHTQTIPRRGGTLPKNDTAGESNSRDTTTRRLPLENDELEMDDRTDTTPGLGEVAEEEKEEEAQAEVSNTRPKEGAAATEPEVAEHSRSSSVVIMSPRPSSVAPSPVVISLLDDEPDPLPTPVMPFSCAVPPPKEMKEEEEQTPCVKQQLSKLRKVHQPDAKAIYSWLHHDTPPTAHDGHGIEMALASLQAEIRQQRREAKEHWKYMDERLSKMDSCMEDVFSQLHLVNRGNELLGQRIDRQEEIFSGVKDWINDIYNMLEDMREQGLAREGGKAFFN